MSLIVMTVYARLEALSRADLGPDPTPVELVRSGLCDPVRIFVKQEPHPLRKINEGRFRIISSVSLVDQVVERVLFGYQNRLEISQWKQCPSKPGMGLSQEHQAKAVWDYAAYRATGCPAAEADISGFDWSVQHWELEADVEMRICLGSFGPKVAKAARNRFACLANSVFQLSDGTLIAQGLPGLMKSGSYCTSSSNSRIRCLMAKLIGSPWCMAMGDDSVEGFVAEAQQKYSALGHQCKDYIACETKLVEGRAQLSKMNFCSHEISSTGCFLTTWEKTFFRFLHAEKPQFRELEAELHGSPMWTSIHRYLRRVGLAPDKRNDEVCTKRSEAEARESEIHQESSEGWCDDAVPHCIPQ
jgi:hypothetical protein